MRTVLPAAATIIGLAALAASTGGRDRLSATAITTGLLATYWLLARKAGLPAHLAMTALVLLHAAGVAFDLYALPTFDVYAHLGAAYAVTLLIQDALDSPYAPLLALGATLLLGLGVELVEAYEAYRGTGLCNHYCPYWQDTVNDMVNDALGALLALIPSTRGRG